MDTKVRIEMDLQLSEKENIKDFIPFKAHENDAAYDIMAAENSELNPLETKLVSAGFRIQLEKGYEAQIRPRSGNALKKKLQVANSPGTIDCGYTGIVGVIIFNASPTEKLTITKGEKIAQMVIAKLPDVEMEIVTSIDRDTDRGEGGFGSTGLAGALEKKSPTGVVELP
jgi:dUTP pyrophosphatase